MLLTSGYNFEGYVIKEYLGFCSGEYALGTGFLSSFGAGTIARYNRVMNSDNEENEIKDLIESNLRQRVLGNTNPVKLGRCFEFLSNYYGFHRGGDRKSNTKLLCLNDSVLPQNQIELAQSYGITQQTMNNYMRMANMIPELSDLVDTGTHADLFNM